MNTQTPTKNHKCCARIFYRDWGRTRPCLKSGTVNHDGNWFCKMHDPVGIEAKREARQKERNERYNQEKQKREWTAKCLSACASMADPELELAEKDAQIVVLREALQMSQPKCILDLLAISYEAISHLFEVHGCDTHGNEVWMSAREQIPACIKSLKQALSTPPPPVVPLEDVKPLVEALTELGDGVHRLSDALDSCRDGPTSTEVLRYDRCGMANDRILQFTTKHPID